MKRVVKIVIPLLILLSGVAFLFFYNFFLEGKINTVSVVVAADNIGFKGQFTSDNLKIERINRNFVVKGAVTGIASLKDSHLLGKLAAIDIQKGTQIYPKLIDPNNLIPDESKGEFIAPIPDKWIFAVPGSIRRSYIADFYIVPSEKKQSLKKLLSSNGNQVKGGDQQPVVTDSNDLQTYQQDVALKPVLKNVRVAHTKDQSNNEVTNVKKGKKFDSTGVVSNIEIIATQEMLDKLRQYTEKGDRLYIVYKYDLKR